MSESTQSPPEIEASRGDRSSEEALEAELAAALTEAADAKDVARRARADLANVRRRAEEERSRFRSLAVEEVCRGFLPILDDLGRAAGEVKRVTPADGDGGPDDASRALLAMGEGVRLVLRRFEETLARQGLVEIGALGQPFDPRVHEALQRVPAAPGQEDGEVVEVYLRGYLLDGRVVRPAQVIVADGPPPPAPSDDEPDAPTDEPSSD